MAARISFIENAYQKLKCLYSNLLAYKNVYIYNMSVLSNVLEFSITVPSSEI